MAPHLTWWQRLALACRLVWHALGVVTWTLVSLWLALVAGSLLHLSLVLLTGVTRTGGPAYALWVVAGTAAVGVAVWLLRVGHGLAQRWRARLVWRLRTTVRDNTPVSTGMASGASLAVVSPRLPVGILAYPGRVATTTLAVALMGCAALLAMMCVVTVHHARTFNCRSRQSEAKTALKAIYVTQLAFHGEHDRYLTLDEIVTLGGLDARTVAGARFYEFHATVETNAFRVEAVDTRKRIGQAGPDRWVVTQDNPSPRKISDGCGD